MLQSRMGRGFKCTSPVWVFLSQMLSALLLASVTGFYGQSVAADAEKLLDSKWQLEIESNDPCTGTTDASYNHTENLPLWRCARSLAGTGATLERVEASVTVIRPTSDPGVRRCDAALFWIIRFCLGFNGLASNRAVLRPLPREPETAFPRALQDTDFTVVQRCFKEHGSPTLRPPSTLES